MVSFIIEFILKTYADIPNSVSLKQIFSLMGVEVYGLGNQKDEDIESVYEFEHFQVAYPQYDYLVPFSPDGGGNFYCFDTRKHINQSCPIVFWISNYEYSDNEEPEVTNGSFAEWVNEVVIEWTLEDYDYDGSKR